jgi:hypothetical protein
VGVSPWRIRRTRVLSAVIMLSVAFAACPNSRNFLDSGQG